MSDQLIAYEAILFPSDGRPPHMVSLMTSPITKSLQHTFHNGQATRLPHPEHYMTFIAEGLGPNAWKYQIIEALDGMTRKFAEPYIIFYPAVSRDNLKFPINKCIREIQGARGSKETSPWRGDIIVAKFSKNPFSNMTDASMADFPVLRNFFSMTGLKQDDTLEPLPLIPEDLPVDPEET